MSGGTGKDDEIMPEIFSFSIIFDASFISGLQQYFISSGYAKNSPAKFWEVDSDLTRSEERRVGKECRSRWSPYH